MISGVAIRIESVHELNTGERLSSFMEMVMFVPTHRRNRFSCRSCLPAFILVALGCASSAGDATATVERDTIGDTIIVRTHSGSVWGEKVSLVEDLRIGERDGAPDEMFGEIRAIAVGRDGSIYAYDGSLPALRMYDTDGRYLRTIGRRGSGPGEYRDLVGLAIDRTGDLLARDPILRRVVRYTALGAPIDAWSLPSSLYGDDPLLVDSAGRVYAKIVTGPIQPNTSWPMGTIRFDSVGTILDTVPAPAWSGVASNPGRYDPDALWTWHPHGFLVTAFGGRYAIELRHPDGSVVRIERAGQPVVSVMEPERSELMELLKASNDEPDEEGNAPPPPVPKNKPLLQALSTGGDGRIWVRPYSPSVEVSGAVDTSLPVTRRPRRWVEPEVWDVFETDGSYLGRVALPPRARLHVMRGDHLWGVVRDEDDVPYLVRWRISVSGSGQ